MQCGFSIVRGKVWCGVCVVCVCSVGCEVVDLFEVVASGMDGRGGAVEEIFRGLPLLLPLAVNGKFTFSTGAFSVSLSKKALSFSEFPGSIKPSQQN